MTAKLNSSLDGEDFGDGNEVIRKVMRNAFRYHRKDEAYREATRQMVRDVVQTARDSCPNEADYFGFGWKHPRTNYYTEVLLDAEPDAKVVHLIRDGRDCMLSRIASAVKITKPGGRLLVFGDRHYETDQSDEYIRTHRNELEMHLWVTSLKMGMKGRNYPGRYLEVRYEDICMDPIPSLQRVFDFLEVPMLDETREWAVANIKQSRIGKWVGREEELKNAIAIGEPMLRELGYLDPAPTG